MQENDAPNCGRESDLVAFLYGELNDVEKKSFESHLHTCHLCQVQTSEFRSIRVSVAAWRDESLGRAKLASPVHAGLANERKPSALAALRAFFDLSPLWMKGAVSFAGILFCILTVLAVARLVPGPAPVATKTGSNQGYSQQEVNAVVERRVQEELERRKLPESSPASPALAVNQRKVQPESRALSGQGYQLTSDARNVKARRPLSKAEREQLAADLRLVSPSNERSVDLVDEQINQP
jgi:anti-sigma factor RsiW